MRYDMVEVRNKSQQFSLTMLVGVPNTFQYLPKERYFKFVNCPMDSGKAVSSFSPIGNN